MPGFSGASGRNPRIHSARISGLATCLRRSLSLGLFRRTSQPA